MCVAWSTNIMPWRYVCVRVCSKEKSCEWRNQQCRKFRCMGRAQDLFQYNTEEKTCKIYFNNKGSNGLLRWHRKQIGSSPSFSCYTTHPGARTHTGPILNSSVCALFLETINSFQPIIEMIYCVQIDDI